MDIRPLTDRYAVAPQIAPEDLADLRAAGFTDVICNRPDGEVPPDLAATRMRAAAEAAGLTFHDNPVVGGGMTAQAVAAQRAAVEGAAGPVLAYCRSGTRSTVVWALAMAGTHDADALIAAAARGGYDIAGLRPQIAAAGAL
ncbi:TIGR01244 family phosphatase [Rhodobacteraceae bacterium CCMM004]|nr:TIGR01244 family phosphatase [Rhodobacteraceae bacterium CCMM004]